MLPAFAAISNGLSAGLPYAFNGQLLSDAGHGSGFVVKRHTVLTVAHVVFDASALSFVSSIRWSLQRHAGEYEPTPQQPRGSFVLAGYAAARTNDILSGLSPGESSIESRNLDVAALWFADDADVTQLPGRGGQGGYLVSDPTGTDWLNSAALKLMVGYPVEQIAELDRGRMHQVGPGSFQFEPVTNAIYRSFDLKSYPGNSGGPLCVYAISSSGQPFFIPAAVFLGGAGQTIVRAIDRDVVDIINQAEAASAAGGNSTAGGVVRWAGDPSSAPQGFIPALFRVNLLPENAFTISELPGWRILGSATWNYDYTGWYYVTNPAANSNLVIEFNTAPGYTKPGNFSTNLYFAPIVTPNQVPTAAIPAAYVALAPARLEVSPAGNFNSSGVSGGDFVPASSGYTLTNSGGQALTWLVGKSSNWITLSANSGSLAPGAAVTIVVSINTNANVLTPGSYTDTLNFNTVGGQGATNRLVTLTVMNNIPLRLSDPEQLSAGSFRLKLIGPSSRTYAIQLSTNLVHWSDVLFVTNTSGTNLFTNTPSGGSPKGFYRARQLP